MRLLNNGFSSGILAAFLTASLAAQTPAKPTTPGDEDVPIFRSEAQLVDLHVSVLDKNGKMITDVPESAFKVYENNVEQKNQKVSP
jgi:hypothetical protein